MSNSPQIFLKEGQIPAKWLTTALSAELMADGYTATYRASDPRQSIPILVSGSLHSLACGAYPGGVISTHWAEMTVSFTVHEYGSKIFADTFSSKVNGIVWISANFEFTKLLERAAQNLMRQAIPTLTGVIDRSKGRDGPLSKVGRKGFVCEDLCAPTMHWSAP